jgi:hypothetical protein
MIFASSNVGVAGCGTDACMHLLPAVFPSTGLAMGNRMPEESCQMSEN